MVYLAALWGRRRTHDPLDNQCLAFSHRLEVREQPRAKVTQRVVWRVVSVLWCFLSSVA